jgi:hypothetical protein
MSIPTMTTPRRRTQTMGNGKPIADESSTQAHTGMSLSDAREGPLESYIRCLENYVR